MATVKEFQANIMKNGMARTNRFQVLIPLPPALQSKTNNTGQEKSSSFEGFEIVQKISSFFGGGNVETTRGLDLMVEQTDLPGKNLTTTDIKYNGDFHKLPYSTVYDAQQFVFRVSREMYERNIMDEWMNLIYDPQTHEIEYMDNYVSNIVINQLDEKDRVTYAIVLKDAFPVTCNPMTVSNEDNNQFHRLSVSFAYRKWAREGEAESKPGSLIDSLSETPFGPLLTPILSNPAVQRGLEVFERETGIDLDGEAVAVYNQVDQIVKNTTGSSINKSVTMIEGIRASTSINDRITTDQKDRVIGIIDDTLSGLRR